MFKFDTCLHNFNFITDSFKYVKRTYLLKIEEYKPIDYTILYMINYSN